MGKKHKQITLLEDEKPTKAFLNIDSRKMGYNEIEKVKISYPNKPTIQIETTNQKVIQESTKSFSQKIYNE